MPWFEFTQEFNKIFAAARLSRLPPAHYPVSSMSEEAMWMFLSNLCANTARDIGSWDARNPLAQLRGALSMNMPDDGEAEGKQRHEILLHGSRYDKARESLRLAIFYISNNVVLDYRGNDQPWRDQQFWDGLRLLFTTTGMLHRPAPFNLRNAGYTLSAFCEKMFTALIYYFIETDGTCATTYHFCQQTLRWLLQAGQDPNIRLQDPRYPDCTNLPIGFAAERANVSLVKMLLEFGADPSLTDTLWGLLYTRYLNPDAPERGDLDDECSNPGESSDVKVYSPDVDTIEIIDMISCSTPHGETIMAIDSSLLLSLEHGDIFVARKLQQLGADLSYEEECDPLDFFGCIHSLTALSAISGFIPASGWTRLPVQYTIELLAANGITVLLDHQVVADALIRATIANNQCTIRYLVEAGGDINAHNKLGLTALHAAARLQSPEPCKLLLQLGANPNGSNPGFPSPLHIACLRGNDAMIQTLLTAGANLLDELDLVTISELVHRFGVFSELYSASKGGQCRTPLEFLPCQQVAGNGTSALEAPPLLASPLETPCIMANAVLTSNTKLLKELLLAGGDCNATLESDGRSLLHLALAVSRSSPVTFLLLRHQPQATWDELFVAIANIRWITRLEPATRDLPRNEDWGILCEAVKRKLQNQSEEVLPSGFLFLPLFCGDHTWTSRTLETPSLYEYCSLALLQALSVTPRSYGHQRSLVALVCFMLGRRNSIGRRETDVFEAASVAAAAATNDELFGLLLNSLAPISHCAISGKLSIRVRNGFVPTDRFIADTITDAIYFPERLGYCSPVLLSLFRFRDGEVRAMAMMDVGYRPDTLCLRKAIESRSLDLIRAIIARQPLLRPANLVDDEGPLYVAVRIGDGDILQLLLDAGVRSYEVGSKVALCLAIKNGHEDMVNILIAAKMGIHCPAITSGQRTALQQAIESTDFRTIDKLLEAGADIDQSPAPMFGATALQFAIISNNIGIVKKLIERGADINATGSRIGGRTALEAAAEYGRGDIAQMLLGLGFDTTSPQGRLAYAKAVAYAKHKGHFILEGMLRKHRPWTRLDWRLERNLRYDKRSGSFV
ncbi:ankyrin repeat-containing domain protein [Echria macrotheca]|uniref:Ankyrin repeat-containing domain protein n=1 Tax=Echria macrotheca TaxID=438768 RepID=A0AAJ0B4L1_9PEZI|nr:ankyrin repeat-containing domain protein [Echria macrotheca]